MELLNKIQRELKVPKSQFNAFAKYNYRNCEDILEAVKPLLGEGVLTLSDEVVEVGGRCYVKATASLTDGAAYNDEQKPYYVTVTAYAREALDKKGMDEAQITGAASSYARKYALCGLFAIDDGEDADKQDNTTSRPMGSLGVSSNSGPVAPKVAAQSRQGKKSAIADLLRMKALEDPTWLDGELKTAEDYALACEKYTGLSLEEKNFDAILKSLLK